MDDNNLNHLIGERDVEKWVDGFLTVVPDADRDLMHTWFACAIESGRMTVQGDGFAPPSRKQPCPCGRVPDPGIKPGGGCRCADETDDLAVRNDDSEATR